MDALLDDAAEQGILVQRATCMPAGLRGAYHLDTRTIVLRAGMPDRLAVPTLMHELAHAFRGDDGHQDGAVEAHINRAVACRLITPDAYRRAEASVGPHLGALAVELDVARWVVIAYQSTLRTTKVAPPVSHRE
ncbi:Hypothetical protein AAM4_0400 [Actinomyces succiniciruminis]|uniref:IrrE N-terminal-like domain-containing protein n=2 Tax=Actinomyces succiniciruminis TaxID=1522002 RepID=A0A1L7R8Z1_9ACTO|nr:Hypothetical protein AAM4_0400 [Actinomyces succiniciruminis]